MADDLKSDAKENLPIRQNLVDTAVSFLLNPNVRQRPEEAKITFLRKKGLTDSEIAESFSRVVYEAAVSNEDQQMMNAYPLPPYRTSHSFWFYLRSCSSTFVSLAVAAYVLHRFYKSYIEPWLFGSKADQSELSALRQQLTELNNSVSRLTTSVASLEETVSSQKYQMDRCSLYDVESVPRSVRNILDEVSNVKGLLLNRFSFPAPPAITGATTDNKTQNGDSPKVITIPKWQLAKSTGDSSPESTPMSSALENVRRIAHRQDLESYAALGDKSENAQACLKNNCGNVQEEYSKEEQKVLDDDSGVDSHNCLSDSESADQTSGTNEQQEST